MKIDNFEKELFGNEEKEQDLSLEKSNIQNREIEIKDDSDTKEVEKKYWVLCLPRTRIEEVEVYLRSRNIDNYDTFFSLDEFRDELDKVTAGVDMFLLILIMYMVREKLKKCLIISNMCTQKKDT